MRLVRFPGGAVGEIPDPPEPRPSVPPTEMCLLCDGKGFIGGNPYPCSRCSGMGRIETEPLPEEPPAPSTQIYDGMSPGQLPMMLPAGTETRSEIINAALWDVREAYPNFNVAEVAGFVEGRLKLWESKRIPPTPASPEPPELKEALDELEKAVVALCINGESARPNIGWKDDERWNATRAALVALFLALQAKAEGK